MPIIIGMNNSVRFRNDRDNRIIFCKFRIDEASQLHPFDEVSLIRQFNWITTCETLNALGQSICLEFRNEERGVSQMLLNKELIQVVVVTMRNNDIKLACWKSE